MLVWFNSDSLHLGTDFVIPLNPLAAIKNSIPSWYPVDAGSPLSGTYIVPWLSFFAFFQRLGVAPTIIERVYFYIVWMIAGVSAYYMARVITSDKCGKSGSRLIGLVASVFYQFNLFALVSLAAFLSYSVMPLIVGLYAQGLIRKRAPVGYLLGIGVSSYGLLVDWPNVRMAVLTFFIIVSYTMFHLASSKDRRRCSLCFFVATVAIIFLAWSWFLLPTVVVFLSSGTATSIIARTESIMFGDQGYATLLQVSRLAGSSNFDGFYFSAFYHSPIGLITSYLIPILGFGALLLRPKNKVVLFCGAMAIIFLFLGAGPNPPLGGLYKWLVTNYWFLRIFRTSWYNLLGATVFYSVLLGITVDSVYQRLRNHLFILGVEKDGRMRKLQLGMHQIAAIIIIVLIVANAFPLLTPERLSQYPQANLPQSYYQANQWLSGQEGYSRTLIAPRVPGYAYFTWANGTIGTPYPLLLSVPFIQGAVSESYVSTSNFSIIREAYQSLEQMGSLSVDYGFEDWERGEPIGWGATGNVTSSSRIVFEGNFSARLQREGSVSGSLTRGVNMPADNLMFSIVYYAQNIGKSFVDYVLGLQFSDNSWLFYTFNVNENITDVHYIQIPKIEDKWVLYSRNIGEDLRSSYGNSDKVLQTIYISVVDEGMVLYLDQLRFYSSSFEQYARQFSGALKLLSVRFIFYDGYYSYGDQDAFAKIAPELNLTPAATFGLIHIYENLQFNPHIYAATNITIEKNMQMLLGSAFDSSHSNLAFLTDQINDVESNFILTTLASLNGPPPIIKVYSDSLGYVVNVQNATSPFYLVLSENFSPYWIATTDGNSLNAHFIANGYANAWYINKTGAYTVTLEFWPQKLFYIGSAISIVTLILCISYVSKDKIKTIYRKHIKHKQASKVN